MTEEPKPRFNTPQIVERQLNEMRAEHRAHLIRALLKSHPDLVTVEHQDQAIQRIDRALVHLKALSKAEVKAALEA